MGTEISKYDNVKTRLCKEQGNVLGTEQNPEDSSKIVSSEDVLRLENNSSFLRIDHTDESEKGILLVFVGEDSEYLLSRTSFF
jgi:predicted Mrr-cat superfamily restriction endonuclease